MVSSGSRLYTYNNLPLRFSGWISGFRGNPHASPTGIGLHCDPFALQPAPGYLSVALSLRIAQAITAKWNRRIAIGPAYSNGELRTRTGVFAKFGSLAVLAT
jgi:hypothetical protein